MDTLNIVQARRQRNVYEEARVRCKLNETLADLRTICVAHPTAVRDNDVAEACDALLWSVRCDNLGDRRLASACIGLAAAVLSSDEQLRSQRGTLEERLTRLMLGIEWQRAFQQKGEATDVQ